MKIIIITFIVLFCFILGFFLGHSNPRIVVTTVPQACLGNQFDVSTFPGKTIGDKFHNAFNDIPKNVGISLILPPGNIDQSISIKE